MDGQMVNIHTELDEHLRQCISERQVFLKNVGSHLRLTS